MIITIGGIKGGVGKSLVAINLTVIRALLKKRVLLVDGDEQGTAGDWAEHRVGLGIKTPWTTVRLRAKALRSEVLKLSNDYDDVIIDCGGRDTSSLRAALSVSDVFLVPFQPKSFDIWTSSKVVELIQDAQAINEKLRAYSFINCGGVRGRDNEEAQQIIAENNDIQLLSNVICLRKAFSNSSALGLGVCEHKKDIKAIQEIRDLHDAVFGVSATCGRRKKCVKKM